MQMENKLLDFKNEGKKGYTGTERRQKNGEKIDRKLGFHRRTPSAYLN